MLYFNLVQNTRFSLCFSLTILPGIPFTLQSSASTLFSLHNALGQCILYMCCIIQLLHNNLNASNRNGSRNYNSAENFDNVHDEANNYVGKSKQKSVLFSGRFKGYFV